MLIFLGLALGILLGILSPIYISDEFAPYISIIIIVGVDTILTGIRSSLNKEFMNDIFITDFISNIVLSMILVFMGEKLGVPLHLAVLIVFVGRIFKNFALVRRSLIIKMRKK